MDCLSDCWIKMVYYSDDITVIYGEVAKFSAN